MTKNVKTSPELFNLFVYICGGSEKEANENIEKLAGIVREFRGENEALLAKRVQLQNQVDEFFISKNGKFTTDEVVEKLGEVGFIQGSGQWSVFSGHEEGNKSTEHSSLIADRCTLPTEISPMAGPQLVVPADKANMVLNAANARWGSLYNALYTSNIIDQSVKDDAARRALVIKYTNDFLDKIVQFESVSWNDLAGFKASRESWVADGLKAVTKDGKEVSLTKESQGKLVGVNFDNAGILSELILENNGLKIKIKLTGEKKSAPSPITYHPSPIKDVLLESTLTYIIDLEDASISAPGNKYESYRIIKGIKDGRLECEVRGQTRKMLADTTYLDPKTLETKTLKRTALPLVRDVGPHMVADREIIEIDGQEVPEKILDCFITSLIGMRHHVAPKMHGAEEVGFNVRLWDAINKAQGLAQNANKIGIMNEELRTCAQLANAIHAAKDIIFFTNTGFLDYTGSFIDLMMQAGAIAPYRVLPGQTYKTEYEKYNVDVSLLAGVPQIGAGMWAAIYDMAGLLKSKEAQVKGLTDTGWSPSPTASTIHAIAFHIFGDVRGMQAAHKKGLGDSSPVSIESLFAFPKADLNNLNEDEKIRNLDFAVHGLLAYAEPWVRRGIGCSGVKDLSGEALMEDRATARIKAAFVRNWLLHKVITKSQVEDSIIRMAKFVDGQNEGVDGYVSLGKDDAVIKAVRDVIFNPDGRKDSYVEPYFYPAYKL